MTTGIAAHFAAVAHPQTNGKVEAFNKIISAGIKKKLDKAKGLWAEEVYNVLWSIRITAKNSTGETPFMPVYGVEVVFPIEMYEPSLRVMLYEEEAKMQLNLDELPEVRGALFRQQWYKIQMTREYNKRVVKRPIKEGDLLLRKMEVVGRAKKKEN